MTMLSPPETLHMAQKSGEEASPRVQLSKNPSAVTWTMDTQHRIEITMFGYASGQSLFKGFWLCRLNLYFDQQQSRFWVGEWEAVDTTAGKECWEWAEGSQEMVDLGRGQERRKKL